MKKYLFLFFCFCTFLCHSQLKYQVGIGAGFSFLQSLRLETGNVGLKFIHDKILLIDCNRMINAKTNLSMGIQGQVTLFSGWYELNKSIPYYSEKEHIPIFDFESAELMVYAKKIFKIYYEGNASINIYVLSGLCLNFNEGNSINRRFDLRDDNSQEFQISHIIEKAQKLYIPYLRISSGFEVHRKIGKSHYLGIGPYISWAGLQSDENKTTVLKDDPTYISTGSFKRNRNGYGIRLIFSK